MYSVLAEGINATADAAAASSDPTVQIALAVITTMGGIIIAIIASLKIGERRGTRKTAQAITGDPIEPNGGNGNGAVTLRILYDQSRDVNTKLSMLSDGFRNMRAVLDMQQLSLRTLTDKVDILCDDMKMNRTLIRENSRKIEEHHK